MTGIEVRAAAPLGRISATAIADRCRSCLSFGISVRCANATSSRLYADTPKVRELAGINMDVSARYAGIAPGHTSLKHRSEPWSAPRPYSAFYLGLGKSDGEPV